MIGFARWATTRTKLISRKLTRLSQLASGIDEFTGKTPKSANQINGELRKTKCSEDQPSFQLQYWF